MEILVCQVVSAGVPHLAVDDRDLAVVAVVQEYIQAWSEGIEHAALNAELLCALHEISVDEADASHIIVEHADLNARLHSFHQNVADRVPALLILDRVVLHEDELFSLRHVLFLRFDPLGSVVKILHLCILIDRISCVSTDIIHEPAQVAVFRFRILKRLCIIRQHGEEDLVNIAVSLAHLKAVSIETDQEIQCRSADREQQDHKHPCHADGGCLGASEDRQYQSECQNAKKCIDP